MARAELPELTEAAARAFLADATAVLKDRFGFTVVSESASAWGEMLREDAGKGIANDNEWGSTNPWRELNTSALSKLGMWVPALFGDKAKFQSGTGGYRVSSEALGRSLQEDLSLHPGGIKDWGIHDRGDPRQGKLSPIDVVMVYGEKPFVEAVEWLRGKLGNGEDADTGDTSSDARTDGEAPRPAAALSVAEWLSRDLPKPDFILGKWLTTTTRSMLYAPTGIGKTLFALGVARGVSTAQGFLHWRCERKARVLFVDGEMARRVMKDRIAAEVARGSIVPDTMFVLSHEDVPSFKPLNTKEGKEFIDAEIERIGGVDLIIFDNIMSLIAGDMKEEESWRQTLPWVRRLTKRSIGQLWLHHTGHDESHSYGTKTREWQLDNLIRLEQVERPDTDVSFLLTFEKAREREPSNRRDFEDVRVALADDQWVWESTTGTRQKPLSPSGQKFYKTLCRACTTEMFGHPAATIEAWREACFGAGLLDRSHPASARSLFSKNKLELITRNWVSCNETMAWTIGPNREGIL